MKSGKLSNNTEVKKLQNEMNIAKEENRSLLEECSRLKKLVTGDGRVK
jgi:predicted  nucleic acid-binding Zn-ribbon protein